MELPEPERGLEVQGLEQLRAGQPEAGAWCFFLACRLAFARGDMVRAASCCAAADHAIAKLTELEGPSLRPNLLLMQSELSAEAGNFEAAAHLSIRAIEGFKAVGDEDGVIAAWMARAERALRGGNLDAAHEILAILLPAVDRRGDRDSGFWLRLRLASALAQAGRSDPAMAVLTRAMELTDPGSSERMAAAAEAMRIFLDGGHPRSALELGLSVLDAPPSGAQAVHAEVLHAEVLVLCAAALRVLGQVDDATRFVDRAAGFESPGLIEARRRLASSQP